MRLTLLVKSALLVKLMLLMNLRQIRSLMTLNDGPLSENQADSHVISTMLSNVR